VNPAAKVDNIRRPKDAKVVNRRWRDDELEPVLELAPPWMRVAIAIAAYTGMRESDVARVTWVGVRGRPMTARALGSRFFDWLKSLPAGTLEPGLGFHGLRHTLGMRLAEAGCDAPTIAAVLGQRTTQMAEHYSRTARRHHLATAAIARIEERDRNELGKRS
jgi:integrase